MKLTPDLTKLLHHGVIIALLHVASARQPGAAALAIEFDAAQRVIRTKVRSSATPATLQAAFRNGLSLPVLKTVTQQYLSGDRRLRGLRRRDLIDAMDAEERECYRTLVLAAAESALLAQIEEHRPRRRIPWAERMALREIESVFETDDWQRAWSPVGGNRRPEVNWLR